MDTMVPDLRDTVESAYTIGRTSARSPRVEVLARAERRRSWSAEQKLAIVGESLGPDLTPTEVTRNTGSARAKSTHGASSSWAARVRR